LTANLLKISLQKNMDLSTRSFHTASHNMRGKILAYLNTVSLQSHSKSFDIPFDRQQLADYLNIDRTALSKELSKMKKDGLLDYWKNHFKLY
ncbi:MAG: winged helix-turn-helix domain-containing protein, partial [Lachnospiraceae bacterium]|nr:winged helix-turn-helix domain-containing protein [Lachnospiraceae bacterium]